MISALINHLWQSSIVACLIALLAFALRRNQARARYALWLAASLKFLIPFSLLVSVGSHVGWKSARPPIRPAVSVVVQQFSEPAVLISMPEAHPSRSSSLPRLLFVLWLAGFLVVVSRWTLGWWRVRNVVLRSTPLDLGYSIDVRVSETMIEPGVFGIRKPVVLLPAGIKERLSELHIAAIVAHEMCHIRRRDNLAAALHIVVEAVFWFHPLVWWIGERLKEERERACDEEVLELGNEPRVYAESILKTCQFYLETPTPCVSGVTGADLKKRIEQIMNHRVALKLEASKKLMISALAAAVAVTPVVFGLASAQGSRPAFDSVSIHAVPLEGHRQFRTAMSPDGTFRSLGSINMLLCFAYDVRQSQISGGPLWVHSDIFEIEARPAPPPNLPKLRLMVQSLLEDRFKLALHHVSREGTTYELVVAPGGPKLKEFAAGEIPGERLTVGQFSGTGAPLIVFIETMETLVQGRIADKTGLPGRYDWDLTWPPTNRPMIFQAMQAQLGLKLEPKQGLIDSLVIDRAEQPN